MQIITTITQKGQVTLPKKIREKFGLRPYKKVFIETSGDSIKIKTSADIVDLAGTFKPKNKKPILPARQEMENSYKRP